MIDFEALPARVQKTINIVCENYGVTFEQLQSKTHRRDIVVPRQIIMTVLKNITKMSLYQIAGIFGKDHATVIYAKKIIEGMREYELYLTALYKEIYSGKIQNLKIAHPNIYNEYIGCKNTVNPKINTNHVVGKRLNPFPAKLPEEKPWIHPKKSPFKKVTKPLMKENFLYRVF